MRATCLHAQKFIVPCPAIALQSEVIPAAGIVEIGERKCFEARLDCAKEGSYWGVFLLTLRDYARMPSQGEISTYSHDLAGNPVNTLRTPRTLLMQNANEGPFISSKKRAAREKLHGDPAPGFS
jgi:hypothetical protein